MSRSIVQNRFGGPEVLKLVEVEPPTAGDLAAEEVLVRVTAASVNPIDTMTRSGGGMAAAGLVTVPYTPGWDVAGTVEALGAGVTGLHPGQRVLGLARFPRPGSTHADYAVVPATDLVPTPSNLTDAEAGALPLAAMTAWQAFTDTTSLSPGQRVLITGAGGGVGHLAVQLGKRLGAHVVAVASAGKHPWLRELGADEVVDYRDEVAVAALSRSVDVALSLADGSRGTAVHSVRPGGMLIALGDGADSLADDAHAAGVHFAATHVRAERPWLQRVVGLAEDGSLTPTVSAVYDLADVASAHAAVEDGHSTGKIVLRMSR